MRTSKTRRRAVARAHVASNLLALINLAENGHDGGWAHRYTPAEMQDETGLQETASSDIREALEAIRTRLARWLP